MTKSKLSDQAEVEEIHRRRGERASQDCKARLPLMQAAYTGGS